jgi:hypothetical protein
MKNSLITTPNILFAALSAVFFAFAFRPLPPPTASDEPVVSRHYSPAASEQNSLSLRAQQYRQQLAVKLNRQRVDAEYGVTMNARREMAGQNATETEDDLALGVEAIRKRPSQDRPVDPQQPEMQVRSDLLRAQLQAQQDRSARAQFIAQYIANARAEGYVVAVDRDYNVQVLSGPHASGREPQSVSDSPTGGPSDLKSGGSITPEFIRAPFCR